MILKSIIKVILKVEEIEKIETQTNYCWSANDIKLKCFWKAPFPRFLDYSYLNDVASHDFWFGLSVLLGTYLGCQTFTRGKKYMTLPGGHDSFP